MTAAASWLRDEAGCSHVCAIGIGFGGMGAWLATAAGAAIDDLVLWAVPTRGRQLLREIRIAAQLSIDPYVDPATVDPEPFIGSLLDDEAVLLDEAGQVISQETLDRLREVDLLTMNRPWAGRRRCLMLQRTGSAPDGNLAAHLSALGCDVTTADGDSYWATVAPPRPPSSSRAAFGFVKGRPRFPWPVARSKRS